MTDIIERLRNRALAAAIIKDKPDLYNDAADAIIRLCEENEKLRRDVKTAIMGDSAELQDVKRENEKLRSAMHDIYEVYAGSDGMLYGTSQFYVRQLIKQMAYIAAKHKCAAAAAIHESEE